MTMKPAAFFLLVLTACLTGCDSTEVDPFENDGRYYTVYGFLDPFSVEQELRVVPIRRTLENITSVSDPQASIDAFVTTTELETQQEIVWRHTLTEVVGPDSQYVHIYRALFNPLEGRTYALRVARANGNAATAQTTVPAVNRYEATLHDITPDSLILDILVPDIEQIWNVTVNFTLLGGGVVRIDLGRPGTPTADGWRYQINLIDAYRELSNRLNGDPNGQVRLEFYGVQTTLMPPDWLVVAEGEVDVNALAQPGVASNVEGGYGYWGSLGFHLKDWFVTPEIQRRFDTQD